MSMFRESGTQLVTLSDRLGLKVPRAVRRTTRSFMLVLALLVTIYIVSEVTGQAGVALALAWLLAYVAFIVTLRAVGAQPRTVYINLVVMATLFALAAVGLMTDLEPLVAPAGVAVSIYAFIAPVLIMYHVLRRRRITIDVVFGAVCVYIFVGIDFAIVYDLIYRLEPASFAFAQEGIGSLYYFSYMTLTTVGYGDITPVSDGARALTVVESITGQILLVVVVARLIAIQIAQRHDPSDAGGSSLVHGEN